MLTRPSAVVRGRPVGRSSVTAPPKCSRFSFWPGGDDHHQRRSSYSQAEKRERDATTGGHRAGCCDANNKNELRSKMTEYASRIGKTHLNARMMIMDRRRLLEQSRVQHLQIFQKALVEMGGNESRFAWSLLDVIIPAPDNNADVSVPPTAQGTARPRESSSSGSSAAAAASSVVPDEHMPK